MDAKQSDLVHLEGNPYVTLSDANVFRIPPPQNISFILDNFDTVILFQVEGEGDQKDLAVFVRGERTTSDEQIGVAIREWAKAYLKL